MFARTTYVVVATPARDRWFDLDAVRTAGDSHVGTFPGREHYPAESGPRANGSAAISGTNPAGAPPLDWHIDRPDNPTPTAERHEAMGNARLLIGDVHDRLAELPDSSVDLVVTSPPFLGLRSYLPADHPDKAKEIGSEPTPAAFLDTLLALTDEWRRILTPYGSICVELGDTYAGSGGAGGDYGENGLREGQPKFKANTTRYTYGVKDGGRIGTEYSDLQIRNSGGRGWPLDKCLTGIPGLYANSLAYGRNLLTEPLTADELIDYVDQLLAAGWDPLIAWAKAKEWTLNGKLHRPPFRIQPWRIRNLICWARPNPPVGALGDKFRPATSYVTVATMGRDRWFDLDAVRTEVSPDTHARGPAWNGYARLKPEQVTGSRGDDGQMASNIGNPAGAPPLDWDAPDNWDQHFADALDQFLAHWWQPLIDLPTAPYKGAHYATFPPELPRRLIEAMCPRQVCTTCGEPRRRIVGEAQYVPGPHYTGNGRAKGRPGGWEIAPAKIEASVIRTAPTLGWTDCGHNTWRNGHVLDPFAGSGTTLGAATGCGRDATGIDLDHRNADLAVERCGMFLEVVDGGTPHESTEPHNSTGNPRFRVGYKHGQPNATGDRKNYGEAS